MILGLLGNADLKLDLKNRWLKYVLISYLSLKGWSLLHIYELEALDLASQSSNVDFSSCNTTSNRNCIVIEREEFYLIKYVAINSRLMVRLMEM